jgi:hypothetical protein
VRGSFGITRSWPGCGPLGGSIYVPEEKRMRLMICPFAMNMKIGGMVEVVMRNERIQSHLGNIQVAETQSLCSVSF